MKSIVIHHNPDCGTSRNVLAIIQASGYRPVVIEYLKTGWTRPQLRGLFAAADLTPREALRTTKSPAETLGLLDPLIPDEALLDAMIEHPALVNRRSFVRRRASGCAGRAKQCSTCSTTSRRGPCSRKTANW